MWPMMHKSSQLTDICYYISFPVLSKKETKPLWRFRKGGRLSVSGDSCPLLCDIITLVGAVSLQPAAQTGSLAHSTLLCCREHMARVGPYQSATTAPRATSFPVPAHRKKQTNKTTFLPGLGSTVTSGMFLFLHLVLQNKDLGDCTSADGEIGPWGDFWYQQMADSLCHEDSMWLCFTHDPVFSVPKLTLHSEHTCLQEKKEDCDGCSGEIQNEAASWMWSEEGVADEITFQFIVRWQSHSRISALTDV